MVAKLQQSFRSKILKVYKSFNIHVSQPGLYVLSRTSYRWFLTLILKSLNIWCFTQLGKGSLKKLAALLSSGSTVKPVKALPLINAKQVLHCNPVLLKHYGEQSTNVLCLPARNLHYEPEDSRLFFGFYIPLASFHL